MIFVSTIFMLTLANAVRSDTFTAAAAAIADSRCWHLLLLLLVAVAVQSVVQCAYCKYYKALIITAMNILQT